MSAVTHWVNPGALRQFRLRAGLAIDDVEKESRKLSRAFYAPVDVDELRRWEQGRASPLLEHLETLAEIYRCPVGGFFLDAAPEASLPLSFRGLTPQKQQRLSATTRRSLLRFMELAEWFGTAVEEYELPWVVKMQRIEGTPPDPDSIANEQRHRLGFSERVRGAWRSPDDGFDWWRRRLEEQGIFCFELKLEPYEVRGASMWWRERYPFILVNRQDAEAATGRLFTLLHEYAHLMLPGQEGVACDFLGTGRANNPEPWANRVAARMLVSREELLKRLEQSQGVVRPQVWSDRQLDELRMPFFASRDVVAVLLEEIGAAPAGFYRTKHEEWEQCYGKRKPFGRGRKLKKWQQKMRELGYTAIRTLVALDERDSLPALDAAHLLDTKVTRVPGLIHTLRAAVIGTK